MLSYSSHQRAQRIDFAEENYNEIALAVPSGARNVLFKKIRLSLYSTLLSSHLPKYPPVSLPISRLTLTQLHN